MNGLIRRSIAPAVVALVAAASPVQSLASTQASHHAGRVRSVSELSDHAEIRANAYDGLGTFGTGSSEHDDGFSSFDDSVQFTDDGSSGGVRTGTGVANQHTTVVPTDANVALEVHASGVADASFDDGDITDGDLPFGEGDSEFRIVIDVTNQPAKFSLTGTASASSTGAGFRRGEQYQCSEVSIGVPNGTIAQVLTPSVCGSPASVNLHLQGELSPGQHAFTVSAFARAGSNHLAQHGHAQVQFDLKLVVASCDVMGTTGGERLEGTQFDDLICGMGGRDTILGDGGNDTLIGGEAVDSILGGPGDDTILAFGGNDVIRGGEGDDHILAGEGCDDASGDDGGDEIFGGDDVLTPGVCDQLDGGADDDHLIGGDGKARLEGGPGNDVVEGGKDLDLIFDSGGPNALLSGGGGFDGICGSSQGDVIDGGAGNDILIGNDGLDTIRGDAGDDVVAGGGGGFKVGGHPTCLPAADAADIHDVIDGGPGNDELSGDDGRDDLTGGPGQDELNGGFGNDTLNGGPQPDDLNGDQGSDVFNACDASSDDVEGGLGVNDQAKVNRALDTVHDVEHVTNC